MTGEPFFIVGTGRCGSTLLQRMLTAHPRIGIPAETHFFKKLDPALQFCDPLRDEQIEPYLEWIRRTGALARLELDQARLEGALREGRRSARSIALWLLETLLHDAGASAPRIGDKSPPYEKRLGRVLEVFPEAKIIHIYRDPRDMVASLKSMPWGRHRTAIQSARFWGEVMCRRERAERELGPERHCSVRYESLVDRPEDELRRLCDFLDETFDVGMLRFHEQRGAGVQFPEREREYKGHTDKPLDRSRTGRYRELLTPREIRAVERTIGGKLMHAHGYSRDEEAPNSPIWLALDAGAELKRRAIREVGRLVKRPESRS